MTQLCLRYFKALRAHNLMNEYIKKKLSTQTNKEEGNRSLLSKPPRRTYNKNQRGPPGHASQLRASRHGRPAPAAVSRQVEIEKKADHQERASLVARRMWAIGRVGA